MFLWCWISILYVGMIYLTQMSKTLISLGAGNELSFDKCYYLSSQCDFVHLSDTFLLLKGLYKHAFIIVTLQD